MAVAATSTPAKRGSWKNGLVSRTNQSAPLPISLRRRHGCMISIPAPWMARSRSTAEPTRWQHICPSCGVPDLIAHHVPQDLPDRNQFVPGLGERGLQAVPVRFDADQPADDPPWSRMVRRTLRVSAQGPGPRLWGVLRRPAFGCLYAPRPWGGWPWPARRRGPPPGIDVGHQLAGEVKPGRSAARCSQMPRLLQVGIFPLEDQVGQRPADHESSAAYQDRRPPSSRVKLAMWPRRESGARTARNVREAEGAAQYEAVADGKVAGVNTTAPTGAGADHGCWSGPR